MIFFSLPTGILVNPTESYNAIQSYMRKQSRILYNQKNPNTAIPLFLIMIKYFIITDSFWLEKAFNIKSSPYPSAVKSTTRQYHFS